MGREIRRVPPGWEHPRFTEDDAPHPVRVGAYRPCFDKTFPEAMRAWIAKWDAWERGERPEYFDAANYPDGIEFWEWDGGPPRPEWYRPAFKEEATWCQVYETVSEGTPISPPLPTLEAVADYLVENGAGWGPMTREQAEAFCRSAWAPSFVVRADGIRPGVEVMNDLETKEEG